MGAYRAIEHALAIHGNVESALHPLDGHHSQTHGNKIKQGCRAEWYKGEAGTEETESQRRREKERHQVEKTE